MLEDIAAPLCRVFPDPLEEYQSTGEPAVQDFSKGPVCKARTTSEPVEQLGLSRNGRISSQVLPVGYGVWYRGGRCRSP